jgi:glycosyltransferase involved in cell wall biosynthesis
MDLHLRCDFYITRWKKESFRQMCYNDLNGLKNVSNNTKLLGRFYWQNDILYLVSQPYNHYILNGDPSCVSTWIFLLACKYYGKKVYLWSHGWYGNELFVKRIIKKIFFYLSFKVLLYGNYARNLMIKEGINHEKLLCIYNSLDYDRQVKIFSKQKDSDVFREHFGNDFPTIIFVGRIQKVKKIDLLIHAISELHKINIMCNFILVGKEFEATKLRIVIDELRLDEYVWLYGECYDETVLAELIYNSHVCVSPGNVGLTAMHTLVYGTPVITHNNFTNQMPEFEAIEPGITGDFFIEDSVNDLSYKIKSWLSVSKEFRKTTRTQCHERIRKNYNPKNQIEILLNAIH